MLEGLEIGEILLSETSHELDNVFRIDAEHYQQKYQINARKIRQHGFDFLRNLISSPVVTGHTPSMMIERFYGGDIPFIKTDNLRDNKIVEQYSDFLSEEGAEALAGSHLQVNDIITTIIGATFSIVGRTAIVQSNLLPARINQNIARIRPDDEKISPHYLNIFLNSKHGRLALHHHSRQTEQVNLNCREVERTIVPLFDSLTEHVEKLVFDALLAAKNSFIGYTVAETLLLETLGLTHFKPSPEAINIKSFKDSFGTSGRLDAEYYQPKYEDWAQAINTYKCGGSNIANVCEIRDKNFTPDDDKSYFYIELSDIDKVGGITGATIATGSELPTRARRLVKQGDVLVSSIEGSLSSCALVSERYDNALCSTGFYILRSSKINSETLLVLMKSTPMQTLLKQGCSGTILTAINNDAFLSLTIPLIDGHTQEKIATQIQESFALKAESERLLEVAKRAVEIAIEQDEQAGLAYLSNASN